MDRVMGLHIVTEEQLKISEHNGIKYPTLRSRLYDYGWTVEQAITIRPREKRNRVITPEIERLLIENGISKAAFYSRLYQQGMTPLQAATTKKRQGRKHEIRSDAFGEQ